MNAKRSSEPVRQRSTIETSARESAKSAIRRYGMLTARARPTPDLLVIGTKRGGTTSLQRYIDQHPGVMPNFPRPEKIKGTYFLDEQHSRGAAFYRSHFPAAPRRRLIEKRLGHSSVVMDATPYYLFHPLAPQRSVALCPDAICVALLRDPVERAYSHWKERRANDTEPLDFLDALEAEPERLAGEEERIIADPTYVSFAHRHQSYIAQGRYSEMIRRWQDAVGDRLMVWISEEFYADPDPYVRLLWARLDLPADVPLETKKHNDHPGEALSDEARQFLQASYDDEVSELEALLGRELPWRSGWQANASAAATNV